MKQNFNEISLSMSGICNLRCGYCYANCGKFESNFNSMSLSNALQSIDWFLKQADDEKLSIGFIGGEPLLEFELLKKIVNYTKKKAKEKKVKVTFTTTTNGTVFNEEKINFLKKNKFVIGISLDSLDKKTNDSLRIQANGKGTFDKIMDSIKKFDKGNFLFVKPTFTSKNINNIVKMADHFQDYPQVKDVAFGFMACNNRNYKLTDKEAKIFEKEMKKYKEYIFKKWDQNKKVKLFGLSEVIPSMYYHKFLPVNIPKYCFGARSKVAISPDGKIYACETVVGDDEFVMGDIFKGIDKNKHKELLQHIDVKNRNKCVKCDLMSPCAGTCYFAWKATEGDANKINKALCKISRVHLTTALNIIEEAERRDLMKEVMKF